MNQPRAVFREVLDDDIASPVSEKAIKRRSLFVLGHSIADFGNATRATAQELELVTTGVL